MLTGFAGGQWLVKCSERGCARWLPSEMDLLIIAIFAIIITCASPSNGEGKTALSSVLTPDVVRQGRSYGYGRPYDRDDRPSRCGRCDDDDDDDDDDYDRNRERDDDRRSSRPTYGSRNDRNRNDKDDERYENDRKNTNRNGTDDDSDGKKRPSDDKDKDKHHGRRNKNKNRYDDRDKYRPDYYDRFLRDPHRDRFDRDRYYDEPYPRRPSYDDRYGDYGRYDPYSTSGYRRPYYEDRYDRGTSGADSFGGYGPGVGRGPHDTFRPWDETYRGQAGWDAGGRGYYFASGRPDSTWGQREYSRPASGGGWQDVGYSHGITGYRDQVYRGSSAGYGSAPSGYGSGTAGYGYGSAGYGSGSAGYGSGTAGYGSGTAGYGSRSAGSGLGYGSGSSYGSGLAYGSGTGYGPGYADGYQDVGYGQSSGWRNVGERRPYRDQSGVAATITRVVQDNQYGQNRQPGQYGQDRQPAPSQPTFKPATYSQSTTPATSYLHQRHDPLDTTRDTTLQQINT